MISQLFLAIKEPIVTSLLSIKEEIEPLKIMFSISSVLSLSTTNKAFLLAFELLVPVKTILLIIPLLLPTRIEELLFPSTLAWSIAKLVIVPVLYKNSES